MLAAFNHACNVPIADVVRIYDTEIIRKLNFLRARNLTHVLLVAEQNAVGNATALANGCSSNGSWFFTFGEHDPAPVGSGMRYQLVAERRGTQARSMWCTNPLRQCFNIKVLRYRIHDALNPLGVINRDVRIHVGQGTGGGVTVGFNAQNGEAGLPCTFAEIMQSSGWRISRRQ